MGVAKGENVGQCGTLSSPTYYIYWNDTLGTQHCETLADSVTYANHTYRMYDLNKDNDWEFELDGNRKKSDLSTGHSAGQISTGGESTYSGNTMNGHMSSLQYITTYSGSSSYTSTTWDNHTPSDNNSYYWLDECTGSAHYNFYFGTGSSGNPC
ncbi:MAG: hypothetical protein HYY67_08165 [Thaumarchaeota archaeon]|nr:hypothetical protein [Nitrososphaerota archaeon]